MVPPKKEKVLVVQTDPLEDEELSLENLEEAPEDDLEKEEKRKDPSEYNYEDFLEKFDEGDPEMRDDGTIVDGRGTPIIRPY